MTSELIFNQNKKLTSIEIPFAEYEKVMQFVKELVDFFFVIYATYEMEPEIYGFEGEIFITRFKDVFKIIVR